ncbi:MAG: Ig-like domain-containing protein [Bacteroidetes bacterium]|nr:Ig-like domain-containing protein [Bacteroidota bacterium]
MRNSNWIFLLLFLASCAQILSPGGGPKDTKPPLVVKYMPDSAATNVTGKRIVIRFNEYVQVSDLANQLIVSPPLKTQPEVTIRKKDIVIDIHDTLYSNTTYSICFGNSIKDITENNVLDNFRYVFSTGPVIDSLHVKGRIVNALTLEGEKNVLVMLYNSSDDSAPYKRRPYYFTKTNADGTFLVTNVKAGSYRIFALDEKNSDYLYDVSDERIAFMNEQLNVTGNADTILMKMFLESPPAQKRLKLDHTDNGHITLIYAQPISDPKVETDLTAEERKGYFEEHSPSGDTIDIWLNKTNRDSMIIHVKNGETKVDDAVVHFQKKNANKNSGSRGGGTAQATRLSLNIISGQSFDPAKKIIISSSVPVKSLNEKSIIVMHGKDTLHTEIVLSANKHHIEIQNSFLPDSSYSIFIQPGAVTDWFDHKNDTVKTNFKIQSEDYYSALHVKFSGAPSGKIVLQLLNEKNSVVREKILSSSDTVSFSHLNPGQYHLRMIKDENGNGKWDTGNYREKMQPEKVIYYAPAMKIRSGWDLDVDWKF